MESIANTNNINFDPMLIPWNNYAEMKSKCRIKADMTMYTCMAYNVLLTMFDYDKRIFRPELFERILHDCGVCALIKTSISDYTPVFCFINGGDRYPDGFFKNCTCYDQTGKQYQFSNWRENPEIQVFFNNMTYTYDSFIDKYSYMLSELDTSIMCNVLFSRLKPIPIAKDGSAKARIDQIFNDLTQGTIKTIVQELDLTDIVDNNRPSIEVLNLTDVESSKYIQYLQHLHDNLISRLFFMMGLSINDNGKQAQISIEELNKNKNAAISVLYGWYNMRKRGFDEMKEKTGVEMLFEFSDLWKSEIEVNVFQPEDEAKLDEEETVDKMEESGDDVIVDNNDDNVIVDNNSEEDNNSTTSDNSGTETSESGTDSIDDSSNEENQIDKVEIEVNVNVNTESETEEPEVKEEEKYESDAD